jgi:LysM repeat protein
MTATLPRSFHTDRYIRTHAVAPSPQVKYGVRRLLAAVVAIVVVALVAVAVSALIGVLGDVGSRPAAASDIAQVTREAPSTHVAQAGDTLWSIADRYRGDVGRGRFVDALVELNGGVAIQIGQAIRLP